MKKQNKTRLVILPEMIPYIIELYDKYYSNSIDKNIKDIGEELNYIFTDLFETEYNFDESAYRKTYNNIKSGIDYSLENNATEDELNRIAKARTKLKIASRIVKKERQEANSTVNVIADNEIIKNVLKETIGSYEYNEQIKLKTINKDNDEIPIYVYSDVHYGVEIDVINNKYNTEIAENRLKVFFENIISDVKKNKYKEIYIVDCADMIEGSTLRVSQLVNISQLIIEQSLNYVNLINNLVSELSSKIKNCNINFLMVTSGNHQQIRHFNGKPNEFANEDFGIIIANMLKDKLKDKNNINFIFGDVIFSNINNYNMTFIHGHQLPKGDEIKYISNLYGETIDCLVRGHWHNFDVNSYSMRLDNKDYKQQYIITAPAVCGNSDYSIIKGYSSIPAGMKITIEKEGNISSFNIIKL